MSSKNRYSLLTAGSLSEAEALQLREDLRSGIKRILFAGRETVTWLKQDDSLAPFREAGLFLLYIYEGPEILQIPDGDLSGGKDAVLKRIAEEVPDFNIEQYLVEHAPITSDICVAAGAGTGKTSVMVQRVMFLLHMEEKPDLSGIAMITFTNKSTAEIRERFAEELSLRYRLTGQMRYLKWMEEISSLQISTIHSFFRKLIRELGTMKGYGANVGIKSFKKEKEALVLSLVDEIYRREGGQIPLYLYEFRQLVLTCWNRFDNRGMTPEEIRQLDWGPADGAAAAIQALLIRVFAELPERYEAMCRRENAISMQDIIRELGILLEKPEAAEYLSSRYAYIFCDEFQDSDNVQIRTMALLARMFAGRLFVVGDIKQSIYRFRGATDSAFRRLAKACALQLGEERGKFPEEPLPLNKNYRTHSDILEPLHPLFVRWGELGFLSYGEADRLNPRQYVYAEGHFRIERLTDTEDPRGERRERFREVVHQIWQNDPKAVVTVLTRDNYQLDEVVRWCRGGRNEAPIPCRIPQRGGFWQSAAVLDLCALAEGLLYAEDPVCRYQLLRSPYGSPAEPDPERLRTCRGEKSAVLALLTEDPAVQSRLDSYERLVKERPILTVLRSIIRECDPVRGFLRNEVRQGLRDAKALAAEGAAYRADLEKLMRLLTEHFSGEFCSLASVAEYLRIMVTTEHKESRAKETLMTGGFVNGYTVHSSKGLQFPYVVIPFMDQLFTNEKRTEIILTDEGGKAGWQYVRRGDDDRYTIFGSRYYGELRPDENRESLEEETRLLYVALTRAQKELVCFVSPATGGQEAATWSDLMTCGERRQEDAADL